MKYHFRLENFDLKINERVLFEHFSMKLSCSCVFVGESGSGKTLFLKTIEKQKCYDTNGTVLFVFPKLTPLKNWKEELDFGNLSPQLQEFCIAFFQNHQRIKSKCDLVKKLFQFPQYLFCDDCHFSLDEILCLLSFCKENHIILCYFTNDIEVIPGFPYVFLLKYGKVVMEGETLLVLKEEKVLKKLGYHLPFYPNMSTQLQYYGLVKKLVFSKEELEEELWK